MPAHLHRVGRLANVIGIVNLLHGQPEHATLNSVQ